MSEKFLRRSLLYMPGSSEKMMDKAVSLPADSIILDLEDSVSIDLKDTARVAVVKRIDSIRKAEKEVIVRINSMDTVWGVRDILEVGRKAPDAVIVPKANAQALAAADIILAAVEQELGIPRNTIKMIPLLETAEGVLKAYELLSSFARIDGVHLGGEDLTADLEVVRTIRGDELYFARNQVVFAAKALGIDVFDAPFTAIHDLENLQEDCMTGKTLGFTGKMCIHPSHLEIINYTFTPTEEEILQAKGIIQAYEEALAEGKGACSYRGKMIDVPIVNRAKKVLAKVR